MSDSKPTRRKIVAGSAAAAATMVAAPFVRTAHAAGSLNVGMWDHWVPGANAVTEKLIKEWAEKEEVDVTHDQIKAMTLADRVVVMNHGVIEQVGTPQELYHNPKTRFVAGFIGSPAMNFIPCKLEGQGGQLALLAEAGGSPRPLATSGATVAAHSTSEPTSDMGLSVFFVPEQATFGLQSTDHAGVIAVVSCRCPLDDAAHQLAGRHGCYPTERIDVRTPNPGPSPS